MTRGAVGKPLPGNHPQQVTAATDVTPYATVGKLEMKFGDTWYVGTGTLIAANDDRLKGRLVLTCAHNVWDDDSDPKEASEVTFAAGFNNDVAPFGTIAATTWRFPDAFKVGGAVKEEYALLLLATAVALPSYATLSTAEPTGDGKLLGLYGWDDADENMYSGTGAIKAVTADQIDYEISTKTGASGTRLCSSNPMVIAGIHCEAGDDGEDWNIACRITSDVVAAVAAWQREFAAL